MPNAILDPTGQAARPSGTRAGASPTAALAPRLADFRGATIGLLVNTKRNADTFLEEVGDEVVATLRGPRRPVMQLVRIPAAERRFVEFPHQLSGGMRQRVMIAIALACHPKLLIADEATTALDVTTQAQIMELLLELQLELDMALMLVSHDLGLAASYADEIIVMYAGKVVEHASAHELFAHVRMPYTKALLEAVPRLERPAHTLLPVVGGRPPVPRSRLGARSRPAARRFVTIAGSWLRP